MSDFNYDNEIIEVSDDNGTTLEDLIKKEAETGQDDNTKKNKNKKKLTKKQKIIIIVCSIVGFLLIVGLVLYFVLKEDKEIEKPKEPEVIVEKDNYRYENGILVFLDNNERELGNYECINKDTEKCFVTKINYETDSFDQIKSVYESGKELEKSSKIYLDNFVFVTDDNKVILYDMNKKESILELQSIKTYSTNRDLVVIVDEDGKYGLIEINETGFEYLIRCSYDNLGIVNQTEELLIAQDKDDYYIINSDGKKLSSDINGKVKSVSTKYIATEINGSYNLYSYENEELLSDYDYISFHDDIIALVKGKRLYLVDKELNKLQEDGIRITSNDYNKKYVYNDDNRLVETLNSYEIEVKDDIVNVNVNDDITSINVNEGMISSTLSYLSYFDGKLYFYSDEEKTDVIGSYSCSNKNDIKNIAEGLVNCNIYSNETGISGIYNDEYVFIYDNAINSSDKMYYLYSIKEKKVKGTYSEIEMLNKEEISESIKQIYTSASYVIAKSATGNNKGNYGVLEVNGSKIQGKVPFKYESITSDKDFYILVSIDKTTSIYDKDFNAISDEFSYIKLYDNYYVGIKDKLLNVYSYTNKLAVLKENINITGTEYEIDFSDGFIITIEGNKYSYDKTGNKIVENKEENKIDVNTKPEENNKTDESVNEGVNNGE